MRTYGSEAIPPVIPVYDLVVNYAPLTEYEDNEVIKIPTIKESDQIAKLLKVPFAFLMGRYGHHTAMLIKGKVYEAHWNEGPFSLKENLFTSTVDFTFDPKDEFSWQWLSGLIVTPNIFWPEVGYKLR